MERVYTEVGRVAQDATPADLVLAHAEHGRHADLNLTGEQRRLLNNDDGRLALRLYRHAIAARKAAGLATSQFPLAPRALQAAAARLGLPRPGTLKARKIVRLLVDAGVVQPDGCYRPAYTNTPGDGTHNVPLYRPAPYTIRSHPPQTTHTTRAPHPHGPHPRMPGSCKASVFRGTREEGFSTHGRRAETAMVAARAVLRAVAARSAVAETPPHVQP